MERKSGVVDWQKAGFSKGEVYAELSKYKIKMRTPGFSADSVRFYNNEIFEDRSILGTLEDKLIDQRKDKITYPKFESYNKKLVLSQLIENADFVGDILCTVIDSLLVEEKEVQQNLFFTGMVKSLLKQHLIELQ